MRLSALFVAAALSALALPVMAQNAAASATSAATSAAPVVSAAVPKAVISDPAPDPKFPARLEVIHVPTGGVKINGIVMVASGPGPHPTVVLFHGLPGNEKNLDLAQAIRRSGWNVVAVNYRGSWGSPGSYRFAQDLEDATATLAFVRDPANARPLAIDPTRIVIMGHSLGGWVTTETLAKDDGVLGAAIISAGDLGMAGVGAKMDHKRVAAFMDDSRESLADVTGDSMADELAAHGMEWTFATAAPKLVNRRLLVLYSNDFVKDASEGLIRSVKAAGGTKIQSYYADTDHSWSERRIELESVVVNWLQSLPNKP